MSVLSELHAANMRAEEAKAKLAAAEERIAELERERDEALMLTESCSSLKEMAAACVEAAARIAELETALKVLRECEAPLKAATKRSRMVDRKTVAPYIPNSEAEELP